MRHLILGTVISLALILTTAYARTTWWGHQLERLTFEWLERQFDSFASDERLPVQVVDISKISGGKGHVTSRDILQELLEAIANERPRAIAVDIDFSLDETGWKTDADPKFFDFCLQLQRSKGVPIFLGVFGGSTEPSDRWLGVSEYKDLAAALLVIKGDPMRIPRWVHVNDSPDKLPTLAAALANSYEPNQPQPPKWLRWAIEKDDQGDHGAQREVQNNLHSSDILINYSKLEQLQHETISTISAKSVSEAGYYFTDKMIILGDAHDYCDPFVVIGRDEAVPGVFVEAAAAYTLAVDPLYELTAVSRLILDVTIAAFIILGLWLMRRIYVNKRPGPVFERKATVFIVLTMVAVFAFGLILVRVLSVIWLDFVFVGLALLLHPALERKLSRWAPKLQTEAQ